MEERGRWYNIELPKDEAAILKKHLKEKGIQFESSEAFNLIHFECFMDESNYKAVEAWIAKEFENNKIL